MRNIFLVYDKRASTNNDMRFLNTILNLKKFRPHKHLVIKLNGEIVYLELFKSNKELFFYNVIDVPL